MIFSPLSMAGPRTDITRLLRLLLRLLLRVLLRLLRRLLRLRRDDRKPTPADGAIVGSEQPEPSAHERPGEQQLLARNAQKLRHPPVLDRDHRARPVRHYTTA
jgi:hypothetical protein